MSGPVHPDDHGKSPGTTCLYPRTGIFDDDALARSYAQHPGRLDETVRSRLPAEPPLAQYHSIHTDIEQIGDPGRPQDGMGVLAGGHHSTAHAMGTQGQDALDGPVDAGHAVSQGGTKECVLGRTQARHRSESWGVLHQSLR